MNRLDLELQRLYAAQRADHPGDSPAAPALIDAHGQVRAMVLELARPADWETVSRVWSGVQLDLDLPAPAIAVSGTDGYQLWFSLADAVPAAQAAGFLDMLRARYLADIRPDRVTLLPALQAGADQPVRHARPVPAAQVPAAQVPAANGPAAQEDGSVWSAFVARDLAPMFAEQPWLDLPPPMEGQARLLAPLASLTTADFQRVLAGTRTAQTQTQAPDAAPATPAALAAAATAPGPGAELSGTLTLPAGASTDPKRFLLAVMNNDVVALALRIEAAKALLPYRDEPG